MSLRKVRRFSESDLHAIMARGDRGKVLAEETATGAPRVSGETVTASTGAAASGNAAPAQEQDWIVMPYPVSVNRAYRNFRGRMVMSAEGREFKRRVASSWVMAGRTLIDGPVSVHYRLHPKMTKAGAASKTRQDISNIEKLLSDAMNGLAWNDDKQIERLLIELSHPVAGGAVSIRVEEVCTTTSGI